MATLKGEERAYCFAGGAALRYEAAVTRISSSYGVPAKLKAANFDESKRQGESSWQSISQISPTTGLNQGNVCLGRGWSDFDAAGLHVFADEADDGFERGAGAEDRGDSLTP